MNIAEKILRKIAYPRYQYAKTYAQGGEDILIELGLRMAGVTNPTYLDIGTNHPIHYNNTYLLYLKGAKGVCVEPNPIFNKLIAKYRPLDKVLNIGVGISNTETLDFYILNPDVLSTFDKNDADKMVAQKTAKIGNIVKVPVLTINEIIEKNFENQPDLISIDVEGWNQQIVESFDFTKYRPKVFCIETLTFTMDYTNAKIMPIIDKLIANDYWVFGDTFINTIFVDGRIVKQRLTY
jgi:FkbM family methyltransferase